MMSPLRGTLAAITIFFLSLFLFWYFEIHRKNEIGEMESLKAHLFSIPFAEWKRVEWNHPSGTVVLLAASGSWRLGPPSGSGERVDPQVTDRWRGFAGNLPAHQRFPLADPAQKGQYGFGSPALILKVSAGETTQSFTVGGLNPTGDLLFLLQDDREVVLTDPTLKSFLNLFHSGNCRDRRIAGFDKLRVRSIDITLPDGKFHLRRTPANQFKLYHPREALLDYEKCAEFLENIPLFRAQAGVEGEFDAVKTGLLQPRYELRLRDYHGATLFWLFIGREVDKSPYFYARLEGASQPFLLPANLFARLPQSLAHFLGSAPAIHARELTLNRPPLSLRTASGAHLLAYQGAPGRRLTFGEFHDALLPLRWHEILPLDREVASATPFLASIDSEGHRHRYFIVGENSDGVEVYHQEYRLIHYLRRELLDQAIFSLEKLYAAKKNPPG